MQVLSDGIVGAVFGVMRFNAALDSVRRQVGPVLTSVRVFMPGRWLDDTGRIIAVGGNRVVRFTADGAIQL